MTRSPIVVKDRTMKVHNPREELFESTKKKILGRKGIILKDFFTRKDSPEKVDNSRSEEKGELKVF